MVSCPVGGNCLPNAVSHRLGMQEFVTYRMVILQGLTLQGGDALGHL